MHFSILTCVFALALIAPEIVEADGSSGRLSFSGAVVTPTCAGAASLVVASSPATTRGTRSGPIHCTDPATTNSAYTASQRRLGTHEPIPLLQYFVSRATAEGSPGTEQRAAMVTLTYL
jgi:hypothetical protein